MSERQRRCPGPQFHKVTRSQKTFQKRSTSLSGHRLLPVFSRSSWETFLMIRSLAAGRKLWPQLCLRKARTMEAFFQKYMLLQAHCPWQQKGCSQGPCCIPGLLQDQGDAITAQESTAMLWHPLGPVPFHSAWFGIPFHCTKSWIKKTAYTQKISGIPFPAFAA